MFKKILLFMSLMCMPLCGCAVTDDEVNYSISSPVFEHVKECADPSAFISSVSDNKPDDVGVIISPYYSLVVNEKTIPVYSARTAHGIHSFAYIDVKTGDDNFSLDVKLMPLAENSVVYKGVHIDVLPRRQNVKASIDKKLNISAIITNYGSFSFVFDEHYIEPVTLIVSPQEDKESLFGDRSIKYFLPGDYSSKLDYFKFEEEGRVYYFKSGYYRIDTIEIPDNSVLYLEEGTYITILPNLSLKNPGITSANTSNIVVAGRGIIDYSECCGGNEAQPSDKNGVRFYNVNNIKIQGITIINSQSWTLCLYNCDNATINDATLVSYRVFSDGVMLSGCRNSIVERNFARTGDDGFEVKAAGATQVSDNVIFQYNDCWTDKADAYGCVYETDQDIANITFKDCSVGFAIASWSSHLGCICFQLGNNVNNPKTIKNIKVNNIEIFKTENPAIINLYFGGYQAHYKGYGHIKDIYISNVTCEHNEAIGNPFISFTNHLPDQGESIDKIGTFENINLSNIVSNGEMLTATNYKDGFHVLTDFYSGDGYTQPNIDEILHIRNGEDYE